MPYYANIRFILKKYTKHFKVGTEKKGICFNIFSHHIFGINGVSYEKTHVSALVYAILY